MTAIENPLVDDLDDLPIEEPDVTATEEHERLKHTLRVGLAWRLAGRALVIGDIFVAVGRRQVSPDVLVRFGAVAGQRTRYRVEAEGAPDATIEILSTVNKTTIGLSLQQDKRDLFGAIGVAEHVEIDPVTATIQVWVADRGLSRSAYVGKEWHSEALATTFRFVDERFEAVDDSGVLFVDATEGFAAAEAERQRADRLRAMLVAHGIQSDADL